MGEAVGEVPEQQQRLPEVAGFTFAVRLTRSWLSEGDPPGGKGWQGAMPSRPYSAAVKSVAMTRSGRRIAPADTIEIGWT